MHEYSLVASLLEQVQAEVDARGASIVQRLCVDIGELAGVERDLFLLAFDSFKLGTVCESAELSIHPVGAQWRCRRCERDIEAGAILRCPSCGAPAKLVSGDEIILSKIEMEVPDV